MPDKMTQMASIVSSQSHLRRPLQSEGDCLLTNPSKCTGLYFCFFIDFVSSPNSVVIQCCSLASSAVDHFFLQLFFSLILIFGTYRNVISSKVIKFAGGCMVICGMKELVWIIWMIYFVEKLLSLNGKQVPCRQTEVFVVGLMSEIYFCMFQKWFKFLLHTCYEPVFHWWLNHRWAKDSTI